MHGLLSKLEPRSNLDQGSEQDGAGPGVNSLLTGTHLVDFGRLLIVQWVRLDCDAPVHASDLGVTCRESKRAHVTAAEQRVVHMHKMVAR